MNMRSKEMRKLRVDSATGDVLGKSYAIAIYTLGYEQRSTYAAQRAHGVAARRIAFGFTNCHLFAYERNKQWYSSNGFDVRECSDAEFRGQAEGLLADFPPDNSNELRIL